MIQTWSARHLGDNDVFEKIDYKNDCSTLSRSPSILSRSTSSRVLNRALLHGVVLGIHWKEKAVVTAFFKMFVLNLHILKCKPPHLLDIIVSCAVARNFRRLCFLHFIEVFKDLLVELLHDHFFIAFIKLSGPDKVI